MKCDFCGNDAADAYPISEHEIVYACQAPDCRKRLNDERARDLADRIIGAEIEDDLRREAEYDEAMERKLDDRRTA